MPATRVIWLPWQAGTCECDFFEGSKQWQNARPDKNFIIISWVPNTTSGVLSNLINGDCQIYMRGHGTPGDPMVKPTNLAVNPDELHIRESIDRLCQMGLKSNFRGKIKFYSCYSGLTGVDRQRQVKKMQGKYGFGPLRFGPKVLKTKWVNIPRPEGTWDALAKRGADCFRALGFNQCTFWGYMGLCSREMESDEGEDGLAHKHVQPMQMLPGNSVMSSAGQRGRASENRQQF